MEGVMRVAMSWKDPLNCQVFCRYFYYRSVVIVAKNLREVFTVDKKTETESLLTKISKLSDIFLVSKWGSCIPIRFKVENTLVVA